MRSSAAHASFDGDEDDHQLATRVAAATGRLLVALRDDLVRRGVSRWELEDSGDQSAHDLIIEMLGAARPADAVLSEEGADDRTRLRHDRVWIVDPLDGTSTFGQPPRADWAVHIALTEGGRATAAAVSLPALDLVLATDPSPVLPPRGDGPVRVVASRWHPSAASLVVAEGLGGQLLGMGSAGAKAMAVVLGEADVYAHSGGQYEWDNCAPTAVAEAAGCHVSRLDGSELVYNGPSAYLPDFVICRPELAEQTMDVLAEAIRRSRS